MLRWFAKLALVGLGMCLILGWGTNTSGGTAAMEDASAKQTGPGEIRVRSFLPDQPISRARRPAAIVAVIENPGDAGIEVRPSLILPKGVRTVRTNARATLRIEGGGKKTLRWEIEASEAMQCELVLRVGVDGETAAIASLAMQFLPPVKARKLPYIPEPKPVRTPILIGAHNCPLWEADKPQMWANIRKHPERTPALGFYAQENPEVADWETKWAVEHGVSFFIYCWYRASQGGPVKTRFGSAIHDALFKSQFVDKMKFTIMWENQARGTGRRGRREGPDDEPAALLDRELLQAPQLPEGGQQAGAVHLPPGVPRPGPGRRGERGQGVRADAAGVPGRGVRRAVSPRASTAGSIPNI